MNKILRIIIWPILFSPLIYLAIIWSSLPQQVAVHFKLDGTPDRFGNKNSTWIYISLIVFISILIYTLLPLSYKIDRKKGALENKSRLQKLSFAIAIFMSFMGCIIIDSLQSTRGIRLDSNLIWGGIGLLWCIMGNYMYNIKPNHFAGFRNRWTLNNEENWKKTHQLGGIAWFFGGLLLALTALFTKGNILIIVFMIVTIILLLVPFIYSYRLHKKQETLIS